MSPEDLEIATSEFIQAVGLLVRRVRSAAASQPLSMTESSVLSRLDKNGPATIADLARAEGVKPQSMGTTISSLLETGLVERKPHPTDGRQVNIELTPNGLALRKATHAAKRSWLAQAIAQLDESERQTLFKAGEIVLRLAEK
ncbi:MAG: MarR family transcriptional regulator [Burkholderiaceae bacterium]|nr:MarR family transcriptional regulator [Burkholderiaceae bacterium]